MVAPMTVSICPKDAAVHDPMYNESKKKNKDGMMTKFWDHWFALRSLQIGSHAIE